MWSIILGELYIGEILLWGGRLGCLSARVALGVATPVTDRINHQPYTHPHRDDDEAVLIART